MALGRVEGGDLRLSPTTTTGPPSTTPRPCPSRLSPPSLPGRHSCSRRAKSLKGYSSGSSTATVLLSKASRAPFILRSAFGPRPPRSCCLHRSCWPCTVSSATRGTLPPGLRVRGLRCRRRGTELSPRPLWGGPPPWAACGRSGRAGCPTSLRKRSCGFLRVPDALSPPCYQPRGGPPLRDG